MSNPHPRSARSVRLAPAWHQCSAFQEKTGFLAGSLPGTRRRLSRDDPGRDPRSQPVPLSVQVIGHLASLAGGLAGRLWPTDGGSRRAYI
jgi:hypothetical protein